jgi:hypothetical protein
VYATLLPSIPLHHHIPLLPIHTFSPSATEPLGLPPFLTNGAPLFIPAIQHLSAPWLLPDIQENQIVLYVVYDRATSASNGDARRGRVVGVARCVAKGGMRGAWERWDKERRKPGAGVEDVGRVCETVNIVGDA